jgi:hypothetical protein
MIHDMDIPYGSPENWEQHEREHERYLFSLNALARFYQLISEKGLHLNDLGHFAHLLSECDVDEKDVQHLLTKKEAA